jgi:PAS domain S-box-containing protein
MYKTGPVFRYVLAILSAAVALFLRGLLTPLLGNHNPYHTVWLAVVFSAWYCGLGPSIVTTLLGTLGVWYWFEPGFHSFAIQDRADVYGMIGFLVFSGAIIALGESNRRGFAVRSKLAAIVESSDDAIVSKNLDGVITSWNRGAERLFGYTEDEAVGQHITLLIPANLRQEEERILERLRRGERIEHFETIRKRKDGATLDVSLTISPVRNREGRVIGASKVARDVSERKRAEQALHESEARLAVEANALAKLNDWSSRLWRIPSLKEGLDEMLAGVIELLGADKGNIQLLDTERGVLTIAAQRGFDREFLDFFREVSANDDSACGRALRLREPVVIEDVEADAPFAPFRPVARAARFRSVVSAPLIRADGTPIGMLSAHFASCHRPTDQDLRRLDLYVRQCVDFIQRCKAEEALRQSEERFRAIVETTPECVMVVAPDGALLHMNSSGLKMFGADSAETVVGKNVYDLIAPNDRNRFRAFSERICRGEKGSLEFDIVGRRGERRHMETHAAPLRNLDGTVVQLAVTRDITTRKQAEEAIREKELAARLLKLQDEERRRIARELHDGVGQLLAAMSMNASRVDGEKSKLSPDTARCAEENAKLIDQVSTDIRTMSYLFHPPLLDELGLDSALKWYIDGFAERSKIAAQLELSADWERLPQDYELCLFRIAQECLTNIHRHSGGSTARLRLLRSPGEIKLEVSDDGKGLDHETQSKIASGETVGVGLRGMRERVRQLGGNVEIRSNGRGATVIATLPFEESAGSVASSFSDDGQESHSRLPETGADLANTTVVASGGKASSQAKAETSTSEF